jgi:hypothetical protein
MMAYAEIAEEGDVSIPTRGIENVWSKAGMRFKLLAEEDVLVLRLVREEVTQFDKGSLLPQQQALKNIWDSKEEDVYELLTI